MEYYWIWAVLLLVLGMCLGIMEVFFTSAGLLAFLSAASIIAAVILGFMRAAWCGGPRDLDRGHGRYAHRGGFGL